MTFAHADLNTTNMTIVLNESELKDAVRAWLEARGVRATTNGIHVVIRNKKTGNATYLSADEAAQAHCADVVLPSNGDPYRSSQPPPDTDDR